MLTETNELTRQPSGLFVRDGSRSIACSDGDDSERYLAEVLSGASDLSSVSAELEKRIRDWPSEHHLSAKRANILRGLDLPAQGRALEIGCGCGAISRYLGEQGLTVDAVEGSRVRAELAAKRCRGLDNVNIICANFNELTLPSGAYDLVVAVGVIEHAARFRPGEASDKDAVVGVLKSLKKSLRPGGVIIVAIENRTGLKYVLGAHEDHYARRYIGIHDYPYSAGIRTYTRNEWSDLIAAADIAQARYLLPFPDYKVSTVVLSEDYATRNPGSFAHLEGVNSRDYHMLINLGVHETVFWQSASANGTLPAFANSFLILISDSGRALDDMADIDFAHLPDFKRKRGYSVLVRKRAASDWVERKRISREDPASPGLMHIVRDEPWLDGRLLSVEWSRSLLIDPWAVRFKEHLRRYYDYLANQDLDIDLVPNNIIVLDSGEYARFDREWEMETPPERDYVLFRALMLFALRHKPALREFSRRQSLYTIWDFIVFGFSQLDMDVLARIRRFIALEQQFQDLVNENTVEGSVEALLSRHLYGQDNASPVYGKVYWKRHDEQYSEERSLTIATEPRGEEAMLVFELPASAANLSHIRFDPSDQRIMDDIGFIQISGLRVEARVD
ncbi:class I SAM-dependent methyltransferase, partial [Pseudomonadota bacterium]